MTTAGETSPTERARAAAAYQGKRVATVTAQVLTGRPNFCHQATMETALGLQAVIVHGLQASSEDLRARLTRLWNHLTLRR